MLASPLRAPRYAAGEEYFDTLETHLDAPRWGTLVSPLRVNG
jgi:hypothetical protein